MTLARRPPRAALCVAGIFSALALAPLSDTAAQVSTRGQTEGRTAAPSEAAQPSEPGERRIFYVRQTVGADENDGLSPEKAWRSLSKLESALRAGDTAYVGPGLYREMLTVGHSGTAEAPISLIADSTGEHTNDRPGAVIVTGADSVDETVFVALPTPGLYRAPNLEKPVRGVVEMDGPQYRYATATDTTEHLRQGMPELDLVATKSSSFFDDGDGTLFIHTSDGEPPSTHEIELIRRSYGIVAYEKHYITVIGFTFRHMATAGINFGKGSSHCSAIDNVSYGAWQGIRVSDSTEVLVAGNTSFRNGNSGVYFLGASANGHAIGNITYENAKGVRWSSESVNGLAVDNVAFANHEYGVAIENSDDVRVSGNVLAGNTVAQLLIRESRYRSEGNCFETDGGKQLVAELFYNRRYRTLAEYQQAVNQDLSSRENCGRLPERIDVVELHAQSRAYASRARRNGANGE